MGVLDVAQLLLSWFFPGDTIEYIRRKKKSLEKLNPLKWVRKELLTVTISQACAIISNWPFLEEAAFNVN